VFHRGAEAMTATGVVREPSTVRERTWAQPCRHPGAQIRVAEQLAFCMGYRADRPKSNVSRGTHASAADALER
jgi:hypothetical protein